SFEEDEGRGKGAQRDVVVEVATDEACPPIGILGARERDGDRPTGGAVGFYKAVGFGDDQQVQAVGPGAVVAKRAHDREWAITRRIEIGRAVGIACGAWRGDYEETPGVVLLLC